MPLDVMAWLHERSANVLFQNIKPSDRGENRVVVTFTCFNTRRSVGGFTLTNAVQKASVQYDLAKMAHENLSKKDVVKCEANAVL